MLKQADLSDSDDSEEISDDDYFAPSTKASDMFASGAAVQSDEGSEESKTHSSQAESVNSANIQPSLDRKSCIEILKHIIAVKREQAFCQSADKEVFLAEDCSEAGSTSSHSHLSTSSATEADAQSHSRQLTNEEEVFLMNIDYFEQWDRVYHKFAAQEQAVLHSMKAHQIRMI